MAGYLRPPYVNTGVTASGAVTIPVVHNTNESVWEVQQITVKYGATTGTPRVQINVNGEVYSGPAVMLPGNGFLGQTFGGYPYLYMENSDRVTVVISNAANGISVTVRVQYRTIPKGASELEGYV